MRVGIIQSNFIPWRGYFDLIDDVDLLIYHDDLQYTKGDWRNRNKIKNPNGAVWVTVPVHYTCTSQLICDTTIDYSHNWIKKIQNTISNNYNKSQFFKIYSELFFSIINTKFMTISELNVNLNKWIMHELGIKTNVMMSSELKPIGSKTDRLIGILKKVNATTYLSGPSAKNYIEVDKFKDVGISLEYKTYEYEEYPQLNGDYEPNVTILDLLFNVGPDAKKYLKSLKLNEKVG